MKSITIHGLEKELYSSLKTKADSEGLSLNKTIKKILEKALGIKPGKNMERHNEFKEFKNLWKASDMYEFEKNTEQFRQIEPEDWQ